PGNTVPLIGAVAIYLLAVGEVKGFAFTLGLTTVFDILVTFLVTAPLVILASRKPVFAKPSVNGMSRVYRLVDELRANGELDEMHHVGTVVAPATVSSGTPGSTEKEQRQVMSTIHTQKKSRGTFNSLYTGEGGIDFIGRSKLWYWITGILLILSILFIAVRG